MLVTILMVASAVSAALAIGHVAAAGLKMLADSYGEPLDGVEQYEHERAAICYAACTAICWLFAFAAMLLAR